MKCIGKDDVHRRNLLNSLKVTVNYTDGTSEMITGSSSTSEGEYLTSDMDSVTCDDEENDSQCAAESSDSGGLL